MTDVAPRPKFDLVPGHRIGVIVLATVLSVGARQPPSIASDGVYEPSRDSWSRIGDLVHDLMRKSPQEQVDRPRDAGEPQAEHVLAPVEIELPSLSRDDGGH